MRKARTRRHHTSNAARATAVLAAALLAGFLCASLASGAGSPPGSTSTTAPTSSSTTTTPVAPPATLYRIVGCQSHGRSAYFNGPARREVAIGFDDGPAPDTPQFVTMLERNHTRATFFMIGEQITRAYRSTMLRELRNGDVLGDHTYTHPELTRVGDVRSELQRPIEEIRALTGYTPCVFRPPYGLYDQSIVETARSLGLATVLWNVDPEDWALPGTAAIEQRVLAQVRPGSIIISHDGGGPRGETLAAYPHIIAALHARGYRIVTIPQLLGFRPVYAPCRPSHCDGLGVARALVPKEAIIRAAPAK